MTSSRGSVVHAVRSDSFAGVERYVCDVACELSRRGWEVVVVGGDPAQMRLALPSAVRYVPARSTWTVTRALIGLGRQQVVHVHMTAAEFAAVAAKPVNRARLISTRHFAGPRGSSGLVRAAGRLASQAIDVELAISQFVARAAGGDVAVLLNGVPNSAVEADLSCRRVLLVQRLEAEKDTVTALRAFAASGLVADGWEMQVAGKGIQAESLRQLSHQLGIGDRVHMLGFVEDPAHLRSTSAIFAATAVAEPFGLSVAEAMAAGMPVLASDGGAHREVLGDTGLLFSPGDVGDCAALLRRLADSPSLRADLGQRARARQRALLSLGRHVDALEAQYTRSPVDR